MEWIPNSNTNECWSVIVIKIARNIHVLFFIHSNKFNQKKKRKEDLGKYFHINYERYSESASQGKQ